MEPEPPTRPVELTGDPFAGLVRFAAEGRVEEAARQRALEHRLRRQAEESATVTGVLVDLAERAAPVLVTTRAGRRTRGRVRIVGLDFAVVRTDRGDDVVVPAAAMTTVRPGPGAPAATGDRPASVELALVDALVELAASRPTVQLGAGGEEHRGQLRGVGIDVVTVALDGARHDVVHVPVAALDHVVVHG